MESSRQLGTSNSFRQRVNVTKAFFEAALTNNKGSGNAWHRPSSAGRRGLSSLPGSAGDKLLWDVVVEPLRCARGSLALTSLPLLRPYFEPRLLHIVGA